MLKRSAASYGVGVRGAGWPCGSAVVSAARRQEFLYASLDNWLMGYLLAFASQNEDRVVLTIASGLGDQALLACVVWWQTPAGDRARQGLALCGVSHQRATLNPDWVSQWLLAAQLPQDAETAQDAVPYRDMALNALEVAGERVDALLKERSHARMIPDQPQWVAAAWRQTSHI